MATRTLEIDLRQGTGASSEPMYGVVTVQRAKAKSAGGFEILPFETSLKLINGKATITEAETDGTGPLYDSAYLFRVQNGYCAPRWGFMAALPDGSTPITTRELPMVDPITGEGIYMDAQEWNALYGSLSNSVTSLENSQTVQDQRLDALEVLGGIAPGDVSDATVESLVNNPVSGTSTAITGLVEEQVGLSVITQGVVGDGITDDTAAWNAAAIKSVALGTPLVIPSWAVIGISSYQPLPENLVMITNGAKFVQLAAMGRAPLIALKSNSRVIGGLYIETLGGDACQGMSITGSTDVAVDSIEVTSAIPGAGRANIRDNAVYVNNSTNVTIGKVKVANYDWPVYVNNTSHFTLGWLEAETYSKALHLEDVPHARIRGGWVHGASPNASYLPGYNGILMESSIANDDVRIENFLVEDSGEHGFRISGPAQQTNIWLQNCMARNVGGTGFKVLGGTLAAGIYNEGITFDNCTVEDAGQINQNTCGFLIQLCNYVRIINPIVRKRNKTYSAVEGIRLSGVKHVSISSPMISDPLSFGIRVDEVLGAVSDVKVSDATIRLTNAHAIYLQNSGVNFNNIEVDATVIGLVGGSAFYAGRYTGPDTGTWTGLNKATIRVSAISGAGIFVNSNSSALGIAAFYSEFIGPKSGAWVFKNGSEWLDSTTGTKQLVKSSSWVVL